MLVDCPSRTNPAQTKFDEMYITADEIARDANVSRVSVTKARARNLLPNPILVGEYMYVWERASVKPFVDAWKTILNARRGNAA